MPVDIDKMFASMGLVRFGAIPIGQTKDFFDYIDRYLPHSLIMNCVSTKTYTIVNTLVGAYNRHRIKEGRASLSTRTPFLPVLPRFMFARRKNET